MPMRLKMQPALIGLVSRRSHTRSAISHGIPGDAELLCDSLFRHAAYGSCDLLLEGVGEAGPVACPRHLHGFYAALPALHPIGVHLDEAHFRAEIERPPYPLFPAVVVEFPFSPATAAPAGVALGESYRDGDRGVGLFLLDNSTAVDIEDGFV